VAKCRRPLPPEGQRIVQVMTGDLCDRLREFRWTHGALAGRLQRDRSRISHALAPSGEELPPRQLIESIARVLDAHAAEQGLPLRPLTRLTMWRWDEAEQIRSSAETRERQERRRATAKRIEGAPPASMETHQDLLYALNALVTARFGSQRAMCRIHRDLGRPTLSAALSDRRSLSIDLMNAILRICGVRGTDHEAWQDAWRRLAGPRQQAALKRQQAGTTSPSMVKSGSHGDLPSSLPTLGGRPQAT